MARKYTNNNNSQVCSNICENTSNNDICKNVDHEYMKNIIEKYYWPLRRWIKWDLKHIHRDFYEGVKNLFYWFKVIWGTREWDETWMYEIERHKLKSMLKYFKNSEWSNSESNCKYIQISINLLDIVLNEDGRYEDDYVFPYINMNNAKRFIPNWEKYPPQYVKEEVRDTKALYLYNKIKAMKSFEWWD